MIKFKTYKYTDDQIFKCEAFSMLIPEGWNAKGGIVWRQHATMPGAVNLTLRSPDGLYELSFLPSMPYFYSQAAFPFAAPQSGTFYMGNEVRPPAASPRQYIEQVVLPRCGFRSKVAGSKNFPELEAALRMENPAPFGCNIRIQADIAQLEYAYQGTCFEGDITCGIVVTQMMYGQTSWIADKIIATRVPKGKKQECATLFATMLKSFRFNIHWYNLYYQYVQSLTQVVLQDIYNAGLISRIISNTYNQISDTVRRSYETQQRSYERVYKGFSEGIRGVNSYYDPYKGYGVEFPSDYRYVYTNPLGEYIATNDPNLQPNVGSNLNWTILNRQ